MNDYALVPGLVNQFIPDHALGFTGIGLPVENTLISFRRLQPDDSVVTYRKFSDTLPFSLPSREGFMMSPVSSSKVIRALAFDFETFAFRQKAELSRLSTVFQGNPIPVVTKYLGLTHSCARGRGSASLCSWGATTHSFLLFISVKRLFL